MNGSMRLFVFQFMSVQISRIYACVWIKWNGGSMKNKTHKPCAAGVKLDELQLRPSNYKWNFLSF
jgi:hypothetical protein